MGQVMRTSCAKLQSFFRLQFPWYQKKQVFLTSSFSGRGRVVEGTVAEPVSKVSGRSQEAAGKFFSMCWFGFRK